MANYFDLSELKRIYDSEPYNKEGKPDSGHKPSKEYIQKFIYASTEGYYLIHNPTDEDKFQYFTRADIKATYIDAFPDNELTDKYSGQLKNWFWHKITDRFKIVNHMKEGTFFTDKNGRKCINFCDGFMHKNYLRFVEYSKDIKKRVQMFLNFMKEVLCSGSDEQLNYLVDWMAKVARGERTCSCPYLKGPEGIGKSFWIKFFVKWVLGENLCYSADVEHVTTSYNKQLMGKLLVYFEELPTFSTKEWEGVSGKLKKMITEPELNYSDKYEKKIKANNISNFVILTNVEALMHADGRRYYILDLSGKYSQNHEYFGNLDKMCNNKEVGEAFYAYLMERDLSKFDGQGSMPETKAKLDLKVDLMETPYRFIKDCYYLRKQSIKEGTVEFYNKYKAYCNVIQTTPKMRNTFLQKLRFLGIDYGKNNGNHVYNVPIQKIDEIMTKNKWNHELDEFIDNDDDKAESLFNNGVNLKNQSVKQSNKQNEIIRELTRQLEIYMDRDFVKLLKRKEKQDIFQKKALEIQKSRLAQLKELENLNESEEQPSFCKNLSDMLL